MNTRLELGSIGIIQGDEKRALEDYVDPRYFSQRKSYDEYYIDTTNVRLNRVLDLNDLMILAERFKVTVLEDCVIISDKQK